MNKETKERIIVEVEYEIRYSKDARKHAVDAAIDGAIELCGASLEGCYAAKRIGTKLKETRDDTTRNL